MKYTLKDSTTVQAIKQYVIKAMNEMKCGDLEVKEYNREIRNKDFYSILQISQEYIDMLNNIETERLKANACITGYTSQV